MDILMQEKIKTHEPPKDIFDLLSDVRQNVNTRLEAVEPLKIIVFTLIFTVFYSQISKFFTSVVKDIQDKGFQGALVKLIVNFMKLLPGLGSYIEKEKLKVVNKIQGSNIEKRKHFRMHLPQVGLGDAVIQDITRMHSMDSFRHGKSSGTVYMGGEEFHRHVERVTFAYSMFSHTNPLHADVFPSVAQFESEVVAMTADMLGANSASCRSDVCGNMTSGGSESILMAVKATRDFMRETKNIKTPEMVVAVSAHSAYDKAAQYFGIRLRRVAVGKDYRASVRAMRKAINSNTIMMVASAPGFPHGVIDPVEELAALALKKKICLHVDLCLGGFVLPFAKKLGYPIPAFDFEVPGVTSMSVDTHKYGLSPKGTSVVLYSNHDIRKHQFVAVTEWSGGLYISPSAAGSRPGGLIAAAWASLVSVGEDGFLKTTRLIMEASRKIVDGIENIEGLQVLGKPDMTVIAFGSQEFNIYQVNDVMTSKGWSLSALQRPASVHICVTLQHVDMVDSFLKDLQDSVNVVRRDPDSMPDGMAPVYGAAEKMPDRGAIADILIAYMDSTC